MDIVCPNCGEDEAIHGDRRNDAIAMKCDQCGTEWQRNLVPKCRRCGELDLQQVPLAILEKGRGTQLSVVGTRLIYLCSSCDAPTLRRYHDNRPNPLMPDEIPTAGL